MNPLNKYDEVKEKIKITIYLNRQYDNEANQLTKRRDDIDKIQINIDNKRRKKNLEKQELLKLLNNEILNNSNKEVRSFNELMCLFYFCNFIII